MKKFVVAGLLALNLACVGLCVWLAVRSSHAQTGVDVSQLRYGAVDVDGDGIYSPGDDQVLQYLVANAPGVLAAAAEEAKVNSDGGVDLSPHLLTFNQLTLATDK